MIIAKAEGKEIEWCKRAYFITTSHVEIPLWNLWTYSLNIEPRCCCREPGLTSPIRMNSIRTPPFKSVLVG